MAEKRYPVVVLAGGTLDEADLTPKAFIKVGGEFLIEPALRAVRTCPRVGQAIIVTPRAFAERHLQLRDDWQLVEPGTTMVDSMLAATEHLPPSEPVFFVCADMPEVRGLMLTDTLLRCDRQPDADVWLTYVSQEVANQAVPGFPHTFATTPEGSFCMAGVAMLRPNVLRLPIVRQLVSARKYKYWLAWKLGLRAVYKLKKRSLLVADAAVALSKALKRKVVAVQSPHGELTVDIDNHERLACYQRWLEQSQH